MSILGDLNKKASKPKALAQVVKPLIVSCAGAELTKDELYLYEQNKPLGAILFARNCVSKQQVIDLTNQIRSQTDIATLFIGIDQEGGSVIRLKPPTWPKLLPFAIFGKIAAIDEATAEELLTVNCRAIVGMLKEIGINVIFSPVLDLVFSYTSSVIGERSFGADPKIVSKLGKIALDMFFKNNILPVIKHMPGHGRAKVDSHKQLPKVDTSLQELERSDFVPFNALSYSKLAMLAHINYSSIDPESLPVCFSKRSINFIRENLGYKGVIMTDSIYMDALDGDIPSRVKRAFEAGMDIVLCCPTKDSDSYIEDFEQAFKLAPPITEHIATKLDMLKFEPDYGLRDSDGKFIDYEKDLEYVIAKAEQILKIKLS